MKKSLFLFVPIAFVLFFPLTSKAIGQITEPIIIKDGLRGQEVVSNLTLLNSEKKQNIIGIVTDGQIASWTTFYNKDDKEYKNPIKEIEVPAGEYLDVAVLFKIPTDIANGDYTGKISVVYNPNQSASTTESSSVVAQKISREVKISVSDQEVIVLKASVIPDKFDYQPGEPIKVRIIYDNQSNIVLNPSIQFKIKKDEQTVYNVIYPYPEDEPAVKSMSLQEIPEITIITDNIGEGKFLAELNFLRADKTIATNNFSFSVNSANINLWGLSVSYLKDNRSLAVAGFIILLAIILAAILVASSNSNEKVRYANKNKKILPKNKTL